MSLNAVKHQVISVLYLQDETKTPDGLVIFNFGNVWRHMKTDNSRHNVLIVPSTFAA